MTGRSRRAASGLVFLGGAGLYALAQGAAGVDFDLTPLWIGAVAVAAGLAGTRHQVVATGLVLAGWGAAVLLVDHGVVVPARTAPAYMLGVGLGLVVTSRVAPRPERANWLAAGAAAAVGGPLGLYLSYDVAALARWPAWTLVLVAMAAWELSRGLTGPATGRAPPGAGPRAATAGP